MLAPLPVLRTWEDEAIRISELVGMRPVFRAGRTRIGHRDIAAFCERLRFRDALRLSVTRLRVTWIVEHLDAGTPLPVLGRAAGAEPTQLARYVAFMQAFSAATAVSLLREGSGS